MSNSQLRYEVKSFNTSGTAFTQSKSRATSFIMAEPQPPETDPERESTPQPDETLDKTIEADIDMDINPDAPPEDSTMPQEEPAPEAPAPTKKDISLRDFMSKMDDYAPIVRLPCYIKDASLQ